MEELKNFNLDLWKIARLVGRSIHRVASTFKAFAFESVVQKWSCVVDVKSELILYGNVLLKNAEKKGDCWRSYGGIEALPEGYKHLTVNHPINFVNPKNGASTNPSGKSLSGDISQNTEHTDLSFYPMFPIILKFFGDDIVYHSWSQIANLYPCA